MENIAEIKEEKEILSKYIPFWNMTDFDNKKCHLLLILFRVF